MGDIELETTAKRMIGHYGPHAEMVADEKAKWHSETGQLLEGLRWGRIATKISELHSNR